MTHRHGPPLARAAGGSRGGGRRGGRNRRARGRVATAGAERATRFHPMDIFAVLPCRSSTVRHTPHSLLPRQGIRPSARRPGPAAQPPHHARRYTRNFGSARAFGSARPRKCGQRQRRRQEQQREGRGGRRTRAPHGRAAAPRSWWERRDRRRSRARRGARQRRVVAPPPPPPPPRCYSPPLDTFWEHTETFGL